MSAEQLQSHYDVEIMLRKTFEAARHRIEFYYPCAERKLALDHLDRSCEYALQLAKLALLEELNVGKIRLRQV